MICAQCMEAILHTSLKPRHAKPVYILLVLFIVPFVLAFFMSYTNAAWVSETSNRGHLIQPAIDVAAINFLHADGKRPQVDEFHGRWTLLYVEPHQCQQHCQQTIIKLRQVHRALGKEAARVHRALALFSAQESLPAVLQKHYPHVSHYVIPANEFAEHVSHTASEEDALETGAIYIVDPHGNMMMSYKATVAPDDVYADMKHLLKTSQIG